MNDLLREVMHDIRAPLTSLSGWLELLKPRMQADSLLQEGHEAMGRSTLEMVRLVDSFSALYHWNQNCTRLRRETCNLADLLEDAVWEWKSCQQVQLQVNEPHALLDAEPDFLQKALLAMVRCQLVYAHHLHVSLSRLGALLQVAIVPTERYAVDSVRKTVTYDLDAMLVEAVISWHDGGILEGEVVYLNLPASSRALSDIRLDAQSE